MVEAASFSSGLVFAGAALGADFFAGREAEVRAVFLVFDFGVAIGVKTYPFAGLLPSYSPRLPKRRRETAESAGIVSRAHPVGCFRLTSGDIFN